MEHSKPVGLSISFLSFHCNLVHDVQALYAVKPFFSSSFSTFPLVLFFFLPFFFGFYFLFDSSSLLCAACRSSNGASFRYELGVLPSLSTIFLPPIVVRREANSEAVDDLLFLLFPLDFIGSTIVLSSRHTQKEKRRATTCISGPTSSFFTKPFTHPERCETISSIFDIPLSRTPIQQQR